MAVDRAAGHHGDFGEHRLVAAGNGGIIHHLGQTVDGALAAKGLQIFDAESVAGAGHIRGGDTTGGHDDEIKRQIFGAFGHEANAGGACDVGNLVRIDDGGGYAAPDDSRRELRRSAQAAFDVNVGIDETWSDERTAEVDLLRALILIADSGDSAVEDGDVCGFDFAAEHVDNLAAGKKQIGANITARSGQQSRNVCHSRKYPAREVIDSILKRSGFENLGGPIKLEIWAIFAFLSAIV